MRTLPRREDISSPGQTLTGWNLFSFGCLEAPLLHFSQHPESAGLETQRLIDKFINENDRPSKSFLEALPAFSHPGLRHSSTSCVTSARIPPLPAVSSQLEPGSQGGRGDFGQVTSTLRGDSLHL